MCWSFLPHVRFLILLTVFELLPKTCNFTIHVCSIFSNNGHVGWCTASPDTILKLDTLVMIQTKFGFHWTSTFRGEDFWKSLRSTTDDDGRQVMAIAHLTLWVRWANKKWCFCPLIPQKWYKLQHTMYLLEHSRREFLSGQLKIWTKNTSSMAITQPKIIRPERNSNLNCNSSRYSHIPNNMD
jgi:hypothetical protein